jgi:hypothetical protein
MIPEPYSAILVIVTLQIAISALMSVRRFRAHYLLGKWSHHVVWMNDMLGRE